MNSLTKRPAIYPRCIEMSPGDYFGAHTTAIYPKVIQTDRSPRTWPIWNSAMAFHICDHMHIYIYTILLCCWPSYTIEYTIINHCLHMYLRFFKKTNALYVYNIYNCIWLAIIFFVFLLIILLSIHICICIYTYIWYNYIYIYTIGLYYTYESFGGNFTSISAWGMALWTNWPTGSTWHSKGRSLGKRKRKKPGLRNGGLIGLT